MYSSKTNTDLPVLSPVYEEESVFINAIDIVFFDSFHGKAVEKSEKYNEINVTQW